MVIVVECGGKRGIFVRCKTMKELVNKLTNRP